jgi:quercetin dioxygenase-like cupin family protein
LTNNQDGVSIDAYPAVRHGVGLPPGPTIVDRSSIAVDRPAGAFELVHLVLDFNPGIWTPQHLHGGQELAMPIRGELTLRRGGDIEVFTAGESWVNTAGLVHAAGNDGSDFAQVVATFLLPAGRPLSTVI